MTRGSSRWSEFRGRGGIWVASQFVLMAGIVAGWFLPPRWPGGLHPEPSVAGGVPAGAGIGFAGRAPPSLGPSLTADPPPPDTAVSVPTGPYRLPRPPLACGLD